MKRGREAVKAPRPDADSVGGSERLGADISQRSPGSRRFALLGGLGGVLPHLGFVIVYVLWGINLSSMKLGGREWDPLVFNGLRFASMIPLLGAYTVIYCRKPLRALLRSPGDLLLIAGLGVLNAVGMEALLQYALQYSNAANGAVLGRGMMPIITVLLALAAGQARITWRLAAGIPLALAGVLIIVSGGAEGFHLGPDTIRGDLLLLARSVMGALYLTGMSRLVKKYPVTVLLTAEMTAGAAALLPFVLLHADAAYFAAISRTGWISLLYTAVLATGLGFWLHNVCLARLGPIKASAYGYLLPVTAAAAGLVLMGETLSVYQCAGAVGVLIAMYLVQRDRRAGMPALQAQSKRPGGQAVVGSEVDQQI
ncbi:DMT family transporter [Paenibacillus athensensis]|uniref:DMT family transporter n=1 Tax=Paenibacillus athensensis TaxID=1967502 RepID=UPI001E5965C5|nr:DMT family transporter [Paenibacillus athensensis]